MRPDAGAGHRRRSRGEYSDRADRKRATRTAYNRRGKIAVVATFTHPHGRPLMNIFANTIVTLTFKLFDADNRLIEETDEPIAYLHGGHSGIFPKVEEALAGHHPGDKVSVTLEPDDAFGDYDTSLMRIEALDRLPGDVAVGGHLATEHDGHEHVWRVTDIADGKAVLDGNHELAGMRLRFDCTVVDVRPATPDEIAHGHVHGAHGHHH